MVDNDKYFLCDLGVMRELASLIEHVDLTIASRFAVCCAPISLEPFLSSMFVQVRCHPPHYSSLFTIYESMFTLQFASHVSKNTPLTLSVLCEMIGWPLRPPSNVVELSHLERVFDSLDLYAWLRCVGFSLEVFSTLSLYLLLILTRLS